MPRKNLVIGQKVQPEKVALAKELRDTMTPAERYLWQQLRANRLDGWHFRRQQIIDGFIVDFYCHQADLVIEIDGPIHESQQAADGSCHFNPYWSYGAAFHEPRGYGQCASGAQSNSGRFAQCATYPPTPFLRGRGS